MHYSDGPLGAGQLDGRGVKGVGRHLPRQLMLVVLVLDREIVKNIERCLKIPKYPKRRGDIPQIKIFNRSLYKLQVIINELKLNLMNYKGI